MLREFVLFKWVIFTVRFFSKKKPFLPEATLAWTALKICPRRSLAVQFMFVKINSKRSNGVKQLLRISGSEQLSVTGHVHYE